MTIVKRGNSFGVKTWDAGRKRYRWVGSFPTREQALEAERDATFRPGKEMPTVERWSRVWLSDYARPAPATRVVYAQAVRAINAEIGKLRLSDVDRVRARSLAVGWPRNTSAIARTMWNDAKRDGIVKDNPWQDMRLRQSRGRKHIVALTEPQIAQLADVADRAHGEYGLEARAIILTLGFVGVRPGELCALEWDDIDAPRGELHVRRAIDGVGGVKLPKNGQQRTVVIPDLVLDALAGVPKRLDDDLIFHSLTGRPLNKGSVSYVWRTVAAAWEALGHPHLTMYELRHACLTVLVEQGVSPSDVAVQAGHTDGGVLVQKLYGHPDEERARDRLRMAYGQIRLPDVERERERRAG